jgi:hypothetical protein
MQKKAAPPKTKPLAGLRNTAKGEIHHMEIHPAKNSAGGQAFITRTFRKPAPAEQAAADKAGRYLPDFREDGNGTPHEDGQDMLDHVAKSYGIKPGAGDDDDMDDDEDEGEGEGEEE